MGTLEILIIVITVGISYGFGCLCGYQSAKRYYSKNIDLRGYRVSEAFAFFLKREIYRHEGDIARAKDELEFLKTKGIVAPDLPLDRWIKVK